VRSPPPEEEGVAETTCDDTRGEEGENMGGKLSLGRREGWEEGVLRSGFISHYPTLI